MNFGAHIESNIDEVIADLERQEIPREEYVGEILNTASYAQALHDRIGYWVFNDSVLESFWNEETLKATEAADTKGEFLSHGGMVEAARAALESTVEFYTSVIGTKSTPGRVKPPPRDQHPGQWADDTELLVNSYLQYLRAGGITLIYPTAQAA